MVVLRTTLFNYHCIWGGDYMPDEIIYRFLSSINNLAGQEFVERAKAYIATFIPQEQRNEYYVLTVLSQYCDRAEVAEAQFYALAGWFGRYH